LECLTQTETKKNCQWQRNATFIVIIIYKVQAYWPVPISLLGELIHPSHRWSTSISSSLRVIVEYFRMDSVGWHS
jgi:hypothetical protein